MEIKLLPVKMSRITSNNYALYVYIPIMARKLLGLRKGSKVAIYLDPNQKCLIIKPVKLPSEEEEE